MLKISLFSPFIRAPYPIRQLSNEIHFEAVSNLSKQWDCIANSLKLKGYVVLEGKDSKVSTFKQVACLFGTSQRHVRNPKTGITDIVDISQTYGKKENQVASNQEFLPHTDGTYLNGMSRSKSGKFYRVGPPKFIMLQCVQPAADGGGTNVLVDGQKILYSIIEEDPELLRPIFSPISVMRGSFLSMDVPIFKKQASGLYSIRFSYDSDLFLSKEMQKLIARFNNQYILSDQYRSMERLKSGQILVVDNLRTLHARTAFVGNRYLRRLWIHDDLNSEELVNPPGSQALYYESDQPRDSPIAKYETYASVSNRYRKIKSLPAGISLPYRLEKILNSIRVGVEDSKIHF